MLVTPDFFLLWLQLPEELEKLVELLMPVVSKPLSHISFWDPFLFFFPLLSHLQDFFLGVVTLVMALLSSEE